MTSEARHEGRPQTPCLTWYAEALEVLNPLRWHLNELIEEMESHNRYAKRVGEPLLSESKTAAAKEANDAANKFFMSNKEIK